MSRTQKPQKNLDDYFGVKNGRKLDPIEGINYTDETITYMSPTETADMATDAIVQISRQLRRKPVHVVEVCGGIGGNTMSFLQNPNVDYVWVYEMRQDRATILRVNLEAYGFSPDRYMIINKSFDGLPTEANRPFVYFDPPWLPPNVQGQFSRSTNYLTEGIRIGTKTVSEWMETMPHISASFSRFPPNYRFSSPRGWNCSQSILGKDGIMVICIPPQSPPTTKPKSESDVNEWVKGIQIYVHTNLGQWMGLDQQKIGKLVTTDPVRVWAAALTHPSTNPNPDKNYVKLSMIGSSCLRLAFLDYIVQKMPQIESEGMNKLLLTYLSPGFKGNLMDSIGMTPNIRSSIEGDFRADAFDAIFGAIYTNGNRFIIPGAGQALCFNVARFIFDSVTMDVSDLVDPRSWIESAFSDLEWGIPILESKDLGHHIETSVYPTAKFVDDMEHLGIGTISSSEPIGIGSSNDIHQSIGLAYADMKRRLEAMSINEGWINKAKSARLESRISPYYNAALGKAKDRGYDSIYLSRTTETPTNKYVQLIGVKQNGLKDILSTASDETKKKSGLDLSTSAISSYLRT